MADISFNLSDLFEKVFGYKTRAFSPGFKNVQLSKVNIGTYGSEFYAQDILGNEYFMPMKITYPDSNGTTAGAISYPGGTAGFTGDATTGQLKTWQLPYPVVSITSRKTIIETPLTERRGTVKELINIKDYEIMVKGFIVGATSEFPEEDIITLRTIYEQNIAVAIQCPLTDIFLLRPDRIGSDQVVIQELKFPAITGVKNIRPYELRMVSDEPFNLITIK